MVYHVSFEPPPPLTMLTRANKRSADAIIAKHERTKARYKELRKKQKVSKQRSKNLVRLLDQTADRNDELRKNNKAIRSLYKKLMEENELLREELASAHAELGSEASIFHELEAGDPAGRSEEQAAGIYQYRRLPGGRHPPSKLPAQIPDHLVDGHRVPVDERAWGPGSWASLGEASLESPDNFVSGQVLPPPPVNFVSGQVLPPPPVSFVSGQVLPPPVGHTHAGIDQFMSGQVLPPPPGNFMSGQVLPPPPN